MAAVVLLEMADFSTLGRHVLLGASIGLGLGIGIGAGMFISRKCFAFKAQDEKLVVCLMELNEEMKELRSVIVKLEISLSETRTRQIPQIDRVSVSASDEETEEDEFYEMSGEVLGSSSAVGIDQTRAIIDQVEALNSKKHDNKKKVLSLLQDGLEKFPKNVELMWRCARSCYDVAMLRGKDGDAEGKKTLLFEGLASAEKAISMDESCANAHKWYAIILGSTTDYESVQNQIKLGFKYKEHVLKAIQLDSNDPSSYHLLGRWCFEVAVLPWWQRKAAAAFLAEPPTSTIDDALENFHKAEEIKPGFWLSNSYWIGKCYKQKGDSTQASEWLKKALSLPVSSDDDREAYNKAEELLKSL